MLLSLSTPTVSAPPANKARSSGPRPIVVRSIIGKAGGQSPDVASIGQARRAVVNDRDISRGAADIDADQVAIAHDGAD
jgi:hypothetical protein